MAKRRFLKGITLLELMISLALSSFLLIVILTFYSQAQWQNHRLLKQLQLQSELHKVLQTISKDLQRAGFRALNEKVRSNNLILFERPTMHPAVNIARGDCVLFFYDLNKDGCIGEQKFGVCAEGVRNTAKKIESELFGYRLNRNMIETRATYKNSVNQSCEQAECRSYSDDSICDRNIGWTDLSDETEYEITALSFRWLAEHAVETYLKGRLKVRPEIEYEATAIIPVINEM